MDWLNDIRTALFIHYGLGTENPEWDSGRPYRFKTVYEFEEEALRRGWNAGKWVRAAKKLRAGYITFACFHNGLGYIKAWKSALPGTRSTKTDFLGQLIEAAKKENIRVLVYITGDPSLKLSYEEHPWIMPEEYAEYAGDPNLDILDKETWQSAYAKEIIREVIRNYPDVGGFWFDGWNSPGICADVFGMIHSLGAGYAVIRNDFGVRPFKDEDRMSLECFGKVNDPDFDFASGAWHEPGGAEYCYVLKGLSDWWQHEPVPEEYDRKHALRVMVTVMANGWTAKIGLGPNIAGDFNGALGKFIDDTDSFLAYAGESLIGCEPGGLPQCRYNDGAYGVTASRPDEGVYYIHLLLPPDAEILIVPDGGILFESAENLRDSRKIGFAQRRGFLELNADFRGMTEPDGDCVIKLRGAKKDAVAYDAAEYGSALPREISIDLGESREITSILIREDDNSASVRGSWGSADNGRLGEYTVGASEDGANYAEITKGTLSGQRGLKQINFAPRRAKFLKFTAVSSVTRGAYIKTFADANWRYAPLSGEPENFGKPAEVSGSFITVDGESWDAGIQLKQAAASERQVFVLDNEENIFLLDRGGTNICAVGVGADSIGIAEDGRLYAVKDAGAGVLRIRKIEVC